MKNKTGRVAVPTHFYKILIKCKTPSQIGIDKCMKSLDVLLFVLPHNKEKICKVGITKPRQEFAEVKVISVHYDF